MDFRLTDTLARLLQLGRIQGYVDWHEFGEAIDDLENPSRKYLDFVFSSFDGVTIGDYLEQLVDHISRGDLAKAQEVIETADKAGLSIVNQHTKEAETPLIQAIFRGSPEAVQFLLNRGADVNFLNEVVTYSPLYHAVERTIFQPGVAPNRLQVIRLLLEAGADPDLWWPDCSWARSLAEDHRKYEVLALFREFRPGGGA